MEGQKLKIVHIKTSTSAGFEPAREIPIDDLDFSIRVNRLNHSAIMPNFFFEVIIWLYKVYYHGYRIF